MLPYLCAILYKEARQGCVILALMLCHSKPISFLAFWVEMRNQALNAFQTSIGMWTNKVKGTLAFAGQGVNVLIASKNRLHGRPVTLTTNSNQRGVRRILQSFALTMLAPEWQRCHWLKWWNQFCANNFLFFYCSWAHWCCNIGASHPYRQNESWRRKIRTKTLPYNTEAHFK